MLGRKDVLEDPKYDVTCECRAIALPLSWLNRFLPTMLRVAITRGAKIPFPSLTFPIIGCDRTGLGTRTWLVPTVLANT